MKRILWFIFFLSLISLILYNYYQQCSTKHNKSLISEPNVRIINNFLTELECENVIASCKSFKKSGTTDGQTKQLNLGRTSETTFFKSGENEHIDSIRDKVSKVLNIDKSCMESVQITKYTKGQEYKYHYDYFKQNVENQRKDTVLIYLNSLNVGDGGQTKFFYGKAFQPEIGTLLQWSNVDEMGNKNINTLHSSKPILSDTTKYILTIWTRCKPL